MLFVLVLIGLWMIDPMLAIAVAVLAFAIKSVELIVRFLAAILHGTWVLITAIYGQFNGRAQ